MDLRRSSSHQDGHTHDGITSLTDVKLENRPKPKIVRPWECSPRKRQSQDVANHNGRSNHATSQAISLPSNFNVNYALAVGSPLVGAARHSSKSPLNDSGYLSDIPLKCKTSSQATDSQSHRHSLDIPSAAKSRYLSRKAVDMMEDWYSNNFNHPYPSDDVVRHIAQQGDIATSQVKKWMANKRVRSYNTLSFNGSIHPKRLRRLQKQASARHHPYTRTITSQHQNNLHYPRDLLNAHKSTDARPTHIDHNAMAHPQYFYASAAATWPALPPFAL